MEEYNGSKYLPNGCPVCSQFCWEATSEFTRGECNRHPQHFHIQRFCILSGYTSSNHLMFAHVNLILTRMCYGFLQVFNEINSRDIDKINIFRGMFSSWIFMAVMIATVVFQVIIIEFLGTFASTVPLDWKLWLLSIVIGLVSMPIAVVLKCIPVEKTAVKEQHDGYEMIPDGPDRV